MTHTILTQEEFDQALREGRFYRESEGVMIRNTEITSETTPTLSLGLISNSLNDNITVEDFQGKKLHIDGWSQKRNSMTRNMWFSGCDGTEFSCSGCSLQSIHIEDSALASLHIADSSFDELNISHSTIKEMELAIHSQMRGFNFRFSQLSTRVLIVNAYDDEGIDLDDPNEMHMSLFNSERDQDPDFLIRISRYLQTNLPQVAQGFRLMYPNCEIRYTGDMRHLIR